MNGHIQDFAKKLNLKEKKKHKNKQTKKKKQEKNEHSSSCTASYRMIQAAAKDFKPNSGATIVFSLGKRACNWREKSLTFLSFSLER